MATVGVDFFRVDRARTVRRVLVLAGALVTVGATVVGAHLVHRLPERLGRLVSLAGGGITMCGLILGFGAMAMLLFENVYVLITEAGLVLHENGKETTIPWGDLTGVRLGAERGTLLFETTAEADAVPWFAGGAAADIAARVETARRRALHGLRPAV